MGINPSFFKTQLKEVLETYRHHSYRQVEKGL